MASIQLLPQKKPLFSSWVTGFTVYLLFRGVWVANFYSQIFPTHLQTERANPAERVLLSHWGFPTSSSPTGRRRGTSEYHGACGR